MLELIKARERFVSKLSLEDAVIDRRNILISKMETATVKRASVRTKKKELSPEEALEILKKLKGLGYNVSDEVLNR